MGRGAAGPSPGAAAAPARVSVWSDYVCPFCYLELPVLERLKAELGDGVEVDWRAFELRPEPLPTLDPDGPYLHRVWNASVYPMAQARGLALRLPPVQPRSRKALQAAEQARREGRFDTFHRALFEAFFAHGRDIGDTEVLVDVGRPVGVDAAALREALEADRHLGKVLADEEEARRRGLHGVPALLVTGADGQEELLLEGAVPYATLREAVDAMG